MVYGITMYIRYNHPNGLIFVRGVGQRGTSCGHFFPILTAATNQQPVINDIK